MLTRDETWELIQDVADLADLLQEGLFPVPLGIAAALIGIRRDSLEEQVERGTRKGCIFEGQKCVEVPINPREIGGYFEKRKPGRK